MRQYIESQTERRYQATEHSTEQNISPFASSFDLDNQPDGAGKKANIPARSCSTETSSLPCKQIFDCDMSGLTSLKTSQYLFIYILHQNYRRTEKKLT